jgi:MoaA/NifB/PqqE/SkfB family radical SAM enzyme
LVKKENELTVKDWLSIIKQGNELGVEEWHICGGGEPFFFLDEAMKVVKKIKESGRRGEVITNGTLFDRDAIETMVEIEWDKIYFSLDSPFKKTQDELRGAKCFELIIKNVKSFVEAKRKLKSTLPILCFHMVISNRNYRQIPEMMRLAQSLGIQEVLLNALNIWKPEVNKLKLSKEQEKELIKILDESLKLAKELKVGTNVEEFKDSELFKKANVMNKALESKVEKTEFINNILKAPCFYPWYNISIFADGIVQPCFIPQGKGEQIRGRSLSEIWFGSRFEKIREELMEGKLSKFCAKCNPWNFRKMGEIRKELNFQIITNK